MRVALYLRVSTEDQTSENQARQQREFAATQSWTITHEFCDDAVSGAKAEGQPPARGETLRTIVRKLRVSPALLCLRFK